MIKIEFPAHNKALAAVLGKALSEYGCLTEKEATLSADNMPPGLSDAIEEFGQGVVDLAESHYDVEVDTGPKSVGSATERDGSTGTQTLGLAPASDPDELGVPFHSNYCGKATDPFYKSGKKKGQWKKRQGVDEAVYDKWYAGQLEQVKVAAPVSEQGAVDTAAAFGGTAGELPPPSTPPKDAGELMVWTSEMQAANRLTQEDIGYAYEQAGITVNDLFTDDAAAAAANVAALYAILQPVSVAQ